MSWEQITLGSISLNIQTGPFGVQLHQSDYSDRGIPVVMPKDLCDGRISEQSIARVSKTHANRLSRYMIQNGNIIYSRRGDVGRCAYVTNKEKGWLCGTGCLRIEIDKKKADSKFVFYSLQLPETIGWIVNHAVGSTMLNLNTSILNAIPIKLPCMEKQLKIADILSNYDDLIENNKKQIKLLEEAAQRLYKEWFVDLRFPGYENTPITDGVPEGWEKRQAQDFFDITIGKTPPRSESQWFVKGTEGIPWVSISDMGNNMFIFTTSEALTSDAVNKHNVKIVPRGTILLSFKLTVGRVSIASTEMCTNEAIAHFKIEKDYMREYIYCYLKNFHYDSLGSTSSISRAINSKMVKAIPVILPYRSLLEKFSTVAAPLFENIFIKQKEIIKLTEARDRLLPKLMNGELEV